MSDSLPSDLEIAVLLPCFNEATTILPVVLGFRAALPQAQIYVFDNNSTDDTALKAKLAGATVIRETRQGKGNVVRRMFSDIEADIYLMADGDGTYRPEDAPELIRTLLAERADMAVGTRRGVTADAGRHGHAFGNRIFNRLYTALFGSDFTDIFSGYRAFSRRFAKSFPAVSPGFETETEMSVHAMRLRLTVVELALDYGRRPEGSQSKLSTVRDGARILRMFAVLLKETRPFAFFGTLSGLFMLASLCFMTPVLIEFFETGLVPRLPTWVFSVGLAMIAFMLFTAGLILDSLARARAEQLRMHYLALPCLYARPTARQGAGLAVLEERAASADAA
ncbi:glycosyltransferase [Rhizobium sp. YIM 134829]|jgi:glycosyltransferase involved in cell wall biosynthesis|uniref:glycosyltransferase n=1 Tax=Rhizobium sp. YIM 134829 TaxID=3390453 RepID=UPI00397E2A8C